MSDKVELYSTIKGNDVTKPTDQMKQDAWRVVEELGIAKKGQPGVGAGEAVATLAYVPKLPAFVMSFEGASVDAVASFREAMAYHRTDAAQEAMVGELRALQAQRQSVLGSGEREGPTGAPKSERVSVALYPIPVEGVLLEDPTARRKAETSAMLSASDRAIAELGLKGEAKNSYDLKAGNWVVGGRGLSQSAVDGLKARLSDYRTPEAEQAWRSNAPQQGRSECKGQEDMASLAVMAAKASGAER